MHWGEGEGEGFWKHTGPICPWWQTTEAAGLLNQNLGEGLVVRLFFKDATTARLYSRGCDWQGPREQVERAGVARRAQASGRNGPAFRTPMRLARIRRSIGENQAPGDSLGAER